MFWYSLGKCPVEPLLDHSVVLVTHFWGISIMFSTVAIPVCIPPSSAWEFLFLHILVTLLVSCVFYLGHSDRWEMISHCGFDLHFPIDEWYWVSFYGSVGHLDVFFGEMSLHVFCPFLNWIIWIICFGFFLLLLLFVWSWVVKVLYIMWILLLNLSSANIFSH